MENEEEYEKWPYTLDPKTLTVQEKKRFLELRKQGDKVDRALYVIEMERIDEGMKDLEEKMKPKEKPKGPSYDDFDRSAIESRERQIDSAERYHQKMGGLGNIPKKQALDYFDMLEKRKRGD